ncbi:hypothetical protein Lalb_Chr05g0218741 [Lupinus albus]|uniref:Uncharacterized protein n=1 Tax=Lupinus albus TaxID=3870 RepID=A0A6A4QIK1_LUPAL|nr:hypothetical protein Lalb_Chr05g0218741 [Lupinus albus]
MVIDELVVIPLILRRGIHLLLEIQWFELVSTSKPLNFPRFNS